jgi:hypothetical protein
MKIGQQPLDEATRKMLEQAYPEVTFDWVALQRMLQQALATPRAPLTPEDRRRSAAGRGGEGRPSSSAPAGGDQRGQGGRRSQGPGRVPPTSRPQMPPRQRPPYVPGFGDQGGHDSRAAHQAPDPRTLDDTADLPFRGADIIETDSDVIELPIQPYDEPVLEEGLDTEPRRGGVSDGPGGPDEILPVEERTFVVSSGDEDTGEHLRVLDEPAESGEIGESGESAGSAQEPGGFEPATFSRQDSPGAGFTRDEFPVSAAADPDAAPRRRRRRRRGGRRSQGGSGAASQPGGGPVSEGGGEPEHFAPGAEGPEGHDDDSDV